jgi:hypothetical protein
MVITRSPNAEGTNLVDKSQPVIRVRFDNGKTLLLGRWPSMNGKPATECTDEEIRRAIEGDESVFD